MKKRSKTFVYSLTVLVLFTLINSGCSELVKRAGMGITPTPTRGSTTIAIPQMWEMEKRSAYQSYVQQNIQAGKTKVGWQAIFNTKSANEAQKQMLDYAQQLFKSLADAKKLSVLTPAAVYGERGLVENETVLDINVVQYTDGLAHYFVQTQAGAQKHIFLMEPQGTAHELYLMTQDKDGKWRFDLDSSQASELFKQNMLTTIQWITPRQFTQTEWQTLTPDQKNLVQRQYTEIRSNEQPEKVEDALTKGPVWVFMPVIAWEAPLGVQTILIEPGNLTVHIERNARYEVGSLERGQFIMLPISKP